jgi:hypothetical protein
MIGVRPKSESHHRAIDSSFLIVDQHESMHLIAHHTTRLAIRSHAMKVRSSHHDARDGVHRCEIDPI